MLIAVDFDGTIVEQKYPEIGKEIPGAIDTLKRLASEGNRIVLWTVREGEALDAAVEFCHNRGLDFYAVNNENPPSSMFASASAARKISADVYIDDCNLGGLPSWREIYKIVNGKRREKYEQIHRRRFSLFHHHSSVRRNKR